MIKMGFRLKLNFIFICFTVVLLGLTTYFVYEVAINRQKNDLQNRLLDLAKLSSISIDMDKIMRIKPELSSQNMPAYRQTKASLENLKKIDPMIDSVYILVKSEKKDILLFLADSGDKHHMGAYCGEVYDASKYPEMLLGFSRPSVDRKLYGDKWGVFLSGYSPLMDSYGKIVAIIGIDVRAESIRDMQRSLRDRFILVFTGGIIFALLASWLVAGGVTGPLRKLTAGIKEAGKGNLEHKVQVKTNDEFEDLANTFNLMTGELSQSRAKLQRHYLGTFSSLAQIIEAKDPYTKGHSDRVRDYAVNLARHLGLPREDVEVLEEASLLHDIGKIGIPESLLTKPAQLTEEERQVIQAHPQIGYDILRPIEFLQPTLNIIHSHHEQPDGKGYPRGLTASQIPKLAGILAIADSFDAMTSDRAYRKAFKKAEALERLRAGKGAQFDSALVDAFIELAQKIDLP